METFDWAESAGASSELRPLVDAVQFGDGYVASAPSGLHGPQQVWDVPITGASETARDEISAFIKPKLGWDLFLWTPPRHTAPLRWVCTTYSETMIDARTWDIKLRFEQRWQA